MLDRHNTKLRLGDSLRTEASFVLAHRLLFDKSIGQVLHANNEHRGSSSEVFDDLDPVDRAETFNEMFRNRSQVEVIKLLRACGECLGVKRR